MLLGQEAFLATDLRRETKAGGLGGGGGVMSWPRLSTAGAEVAKRLIFCVYTRDELVESLNRLTTTEHQQPRK